MTRFWDGWTDRRTDGQTDGVTALLDLLSPSATQVKNGVMGVSWHEQIKKGGIKNTKCIHYV